MTSVGYGCWSAIRTWKIVVAIYFLHGSPPVEPHFHLFGMQSSLSGALIFAWPFSAEESDNFPLLTAYQVYSYCRAILLMPRGYEAL